MTQEQNDKNVYKIDVRVDIDTISKFNELTQYNNISKTKLVKKMIDCMYDRDIMGNDFSPDAKKDCMTHVCKIVEYTNCIENDEVRKNILKEITGLCLTLR